MRSKFVSAPLWILIAALSAACGSSTPTTTSTSPTTTATPTLVTEVFSGSIGQNGTAVHSFTVNTSGYTLLAGYTSLSPASVGALGLGLGSWDSGTSSCGLNLSQVDVARSGSTALSGTAGSGSFCLRVYDGANIPAGVTTTYTVQVQHY